MYYEKDLQARANPELVISEFVIGAVSAVTIFGIVMSLSLSKSESVDSDITMYDHTRVNGLRTVCCLGCLVF